MIRHFPRAARGPVAALLYSTLLLVAGCAGGESDDGNQTAPSADGTRIELVYVRGDSADAEGPSGEPPVPSRAPASPESVSVQTPPLPSAADEVGGDELITYDADGSFTVQVATFSEPERARRRVRQLQDLGYPAYTVIHPSGGQLRVRIGYFATPEAADRFGQRFRRDHGGSYWVATRAGEKSSR